jgi:hypothetical protein
VRRVFQTAIVFLADWLPPLALLAACVRLLWQYFVKDTMPQLFDFLLPLIVVLVVLVVLHVVIALLLPLRWHAIRGEFQRRLEARVRAELEGVYGPVPGDVAETLRAERKQVERLLGETREVAAWLEQREQAASVSELYGN